MKKIVLLVLSFLLVFSMVACSSNDGSEQVGGNGGDEKPTVQKETIKEPGGKISLGICSDQGQKQHVQRLVKSFTDETPYEIEMEIIEDTTFYNLQRTKIATNNSWDINWTLNTPGDYILLNAEENFIDISDQPWLDRINPAILDGFFKYKGKVYGVPYAGSEMCGVYYNKDVFAANGIEIPVNETDFLEACETLKNAGVTPIACGGADIWPLAMYPVEAGVYWQKEDPDIWDKLNTNQIDFTQIPGFIEDGYSFIGYWENGYLNSDILTATSEMANKMVAEGTAAMVLQGGWTTATFESDYPDANIGMFARPTPLNDGQPIVDIFGPTAFMGYKLTENPEAVLAFLEYWTRTEVQNIYYSYESSMPSYVGIDAKISPILKDVYPLYEQGFASPHFMSIGVVPYDYDFFKEYQEYILGTKTPEQVAQYWSDLFKKLAIAGGVEGF